MGDKSCLCSSLTTFSDIVEIERDNERHLVLDGEHVGKQVRRFPSGIIESRPMCVCIKMTVGSFTNYSSTSLLHCGISDSRGRVYNFDESGYHVDASWKESICIPIGGTWDSQAFDAALTSFHADHSKRGVRYQALGPNCFTYVVEFLNSSNFNGHSDHTVESIEENLL